MPLRREDFGEAAGMFRGLRSAHGEQMVLDQNFFVETILPRSRVAGLASAGKTRLFRTPGERHQIETSLDCSRH